MLVRWPAHSLDTSASQWAGQLTSWSTAGHISLTQERGQPRMQIGDSVRCLLNPLSEYLPNNFHSILRNLSRI